MKADTRLTPRMALRVHATLTLTGAEPVAVQTLDVAPGGMCIGISHELAVGKSCLVNFDISMKGKKRKVAAIASVIYSIRRESGGVKVGLQFVELNTAGAEAIADFLVLNAADILPAMHHRFGPVLVSSRK